LKCARSGPNDPLNRRAECSGGGSCRTYLDRKVEIVIDYGLTDIVATRFGAESAPAKRSHAA
jgi:hypothetical protein